MLDRLPTFSSPPRSILVLSTEYAINADGTYRPGGLALFSRCVIGSLAGAHGLDRLEAWGLLDEPEGLNVFRSHFGDSTTRVSTRAFSGDRAGMAAAFALRHLAFDLVVFLHVGIGRLAILRGPLPLSFWIVGIEVRRPLRFFERWLVKRANPLLSISTYSSDEMRRHNPDLPAGKTVHLSVEPENWKETSQDLERTHYDPAQRKCAVLVVARMAAGERYKGHDQLIEGWPEVMRRCPGAELWITGTGDDLARLKEKAAALGSATSEKIVFLGRVSHEQLRERYRTARVFAMPSTGEGFGLVFTEAMREGVPCICSFDSAQEIVLHEETGLVVPQETAAITAACIRLLSDDAFATRLGRAGQKRFYDLYTFDGMRARVRAAYGYASNVEGTNS